jgi:hypothetical protein
MASNAYPPHQVTVWKLAPEKGLGTAREVGV